MANDKSPYVPIVGNVRLWCKYTWSDWFICQDPDIDGNITAAKLLGALWFLEWL